MLTRGLHLRYKLRTLIAVVTLFAITSVLASVLQRRPLWRDTIFRSADHGTLRFPSGYTVSTNSWFTRGDNLEFGLLMTYERENEWYIIQNTDSRTVATIIVDGTTYKAILTDYRVRGPDYHGEYWIRRGPTVP